MIPGVEIIELTTHIDDRGYFREVLKSSQITKFGQWSMSYMHTGVIKAFHIHQIQIDYWYVVSGVVKAVLSDLSDNFKPNDGYAKDTVEKYLKLNYYGLKDIPSYFCEEYLLGDNQPPKVLVIPPGVAHGLKVLQGPAVLMYITSEMYDPKDEGRIPYNSLGYDWFKQDIK